MSIHEATQYVDLVVEQLVEMGVITHERYARMSESQRESLAEAVKQKSEE